MNDGFHQFFHVPQDLPKKHEIPGRSLRSAPVLAKLPLAIGVIDQRMLILVDIERLMTGPEMRLVEQTLQ